MIETFYSLSMSTGWNLNSDSIDHSNALYFRIDLLHAQICRNLLFSLPKINKTFIVNLQDIDHAFNTII